MFKVVSRQNSFNPSAIKNFLQVREFHHQSKLIALIRTLQKEIHQNWTKWRLKADKWNGWLMNAGADTISLDKSTIESNRNSLITVTTERAWWGILVHPGVVTISGVQWSDVRAGYRAADRAKPGLDTGHNQYFILILYAATTTTTLYYKKRLKFDSNTMPSP